MASAHPGPAELKALQDDIFRRKVLRARQMTMQERFAEGLDLSNAVFRRMHEGAMWQLKTSDPEVGWAEVQRRLEIIDRLNDLATNRPEPSACP